MIDCCVPQRHDLASLHGRRLHKTWRTPLEKAAGEDTEAKYKWLHDIADAAAPDVRAAFLEAVERVRAGVKADELLKAIESGSVEKVLNVLGLDQALGDAARQSLMPALEDAFIGAGRATPEHVLPKGGTLNIRFDLANPTATRWLRDYEFNLIKQISDDTRAGIKTVVEDAFAHGGHPREQAKTIKQMIGLTDNQASAVQNFQRLLEEGDRTAMTRALRDRRFDPTLDRALGNLGEGLDDDQIATMVARYRDRMLSMRAETIARTETINASQAGQQVAWAQASDKGLLSRSTLRQGWLVTPDDRLCIICALIPEMNPAGVPLGGFFATPVGPVARPTVHPNCRCALYLMNF